MNYRDGQERQKADQNEHQYYAHDGIDQHRQHKIDDHFAMSVQRRHFLLLRLPEDDRQDDAAERYDKTCKLRQVQNPLITR